MTDSRLARIFLASLRQGTPDARIARAFLASLISVPSDAKAYALHMQALRSAPSSWPPAIPTSALATSAPVSLFQAENIRPDFDKLVQSWVDQGSGLTDAYGIDTTVRLPTWVGSRTPSGQPAAVLAGGGTGSSQGMPITASSSGSSQTLMACIRPTTFTNFRTVWGSTAGGLQFRWDSAGKMTVCKAGTSIVGTATNAMTLNSWIIVACTWVDATSWAIYHNGTANGSGSHAVTLTASQTRILGSLTNTEGAIGDIAAAAAWNRVLTGTEITDITNEWTTRYLTAPPSGGYWGIPVE